MLTPFAALTVTGNAVVRGEATPTGGMLSGTAIVDYDYTSDFNLSNGVNDNNHPFDEPWAIYYSDTQVKPNGLIASYGINETSGNQLFDEFGALNAQLRGTPTRVFDSTMNANVLSLDGSTQYAVLDRSLADLTDGTYSMWVNPTSSTANLPLLYFGSSANTFLNLTARDANGFAHLTISVNGVIQQLVSSTTVPMNAWTNLAVTFMGGQATFYINGVAAGAAAMSFRPTDVLTADDYQTAESLYLGHDASGNDFAGKLTDIRFYNVALAPADIVNEMKRSGPRIGEMFAMAPMTFNGSTTTVESGVHAGAMRTLSAWVNPSTNTSSYEAILDAYDERGSGNNRGTGFGLINGVIDVRLDGVGLWNTGVAVSLNTWQQIFVTISGGTARVYLNGVQKASHTYTTGITATKNYHVGFYQTDDNSPPTQTGFFNGQLYDVRIYSSSVVPTGKFDTPPTAVNDSATAQSGVASPISVLSNDTDLNPIVTLIVSGITQGAHGTVAIVPGGGGVTYQSSSGYVGSDSFTYTVSDGFGGASTATVSVNSVVTLTSISISPPSASLSDGGIVQFSAVGKDAAGNPLASQPNFTWAIISGAGTLTPSGGANPTATFTAGQNTEPVVIQVSSGSVSGTVMVYVTSSVAPTITTAPNANPSPVTGTSTNLSVLASDAAGEANLVYSWSTVGTPPAAVNFSDNNSNTAKNTLANFTKAGTYNFQVKVTNPSGNYTLSNLTAQVIQTASAISVTAATTSVAANTTDQFTAGNLDQFGNPMAGTPTVTWSIVSGGGSISSTGLLTAPRTSGTVTVRATTPGGLFANSTVTVFYEQVAWYQADTSGSTLTDSSGHGQTATLTTPYNFSSGIGGTAAESDRRLCDAAQRHRQQPERLYDFHLGQNQHFGHLVANLRFRHRHDRLHVHDRTSDRRRRNSSFCHYHERQWWRATVERPRIVGGHLVSDCDYTLRQHCHAVRQRHRCRQHERNDNSSSGARRDEP